MIKSILVLLSFSSFSFGFSQRTIPSGQTNGTLRIELQGTDQTNILAPSFEGQRFRIKSDDAVEGNSFLFEDWKSGEVTLNDGEKYKVGKMNLDASGNKFIYYKNDTMFEFFNNVKEVRIYNDDHLGDDMVFRSDINPTSENFVQVLASGKITVFQEFIKKPEGENYSNGIVNNIRKYKLHTTQYALVNKLVIPLKFSSSALEELTADKKSQVSSYIKENNLKPKKEKDFMMAVSYYNSITTVAL